MAAAPRCLPLLGLRSLCWRPSGLGRGSAPRKFRAVAPPRGLELRGIYPPLATPSTSQGEVDDIRLEEDVRLYAGLPFRDMDRPCMNLFWTAPPLRVRFLEHPSSDWLTGQQGIFPRLLYSTFGFYMLELSYFCSLVITLPFDVKQKDFYQQIVHHAATIPLIIFSYCANYIRIGTLVIIIHLSSECLLEPTKIFYYLKWRRISDGLFIIFSAVFLLTRLVIFPCMVIYSTYYYFIEIYQPFFGYYLLNGLLMVIQLLNIFWSCMIILMVYRFILHGTMEGDLKSDTEDSENNEEEMEQEKEAKRNGVPPHSPNSTAAALALARRTPCSGIGRSQWPTGGHA